MDNKRKNGNDIRAWHVAPIVFAGMMLMIVLTLGSVFSAFLVLTLPVASFYWGYTWHARSLHVEAERERRIIERYKAELT